MASRYTLSIMDFSNELSTVSVPGLDLTSANFDAQDALWDDFLDAINGVSIGVVHRKKLLAQDEALSTDLPTNGLAQRELKWLVRWTGNNSGNHTTEIPCPDGTLILSGTDNMNLAGGAGAALVDAWEAVVRDEGDTSSTVLNVIIVGRTL